ncbi:MAG TPA: outer membrane beta-barrel protein [Calditrichia bacterium]|nr:outer membrane beta-barrel protein [Calditrichota bacterium]HQV32726.1 outer membrane beta-barrel protein [Calditrichia bacterium]
MKRNFLKISLLAGLILTFFALPGFSQNLYIGPQIGLFKAKDSDGNNMHLGAVLRLRPSEALGIEGSIGYRKENYNNDAITVKSFPVMVTGLFYPVPVAYGAIGAGWYNTRIEYDTDVFGGLFQNAEETHQEFGWHFGGGVELPLSRSTRLSGDIRYVFLNYDFEELPGSDNISSNFYVIDIGLLFKL